MKDFIRGLWPRNPFTWLGLILGAMSVLKLIEFGFEFGFGPTFALLLAYYETLVQEMFAWWAEPIIKAWLADLSAYFGWHLNFYPHWKHVFVLMGIYFFRQAGTVFVAGMPGTAIFLLLWGLAVAVSVSVAVGTVALVQGDMRSNFLIVAIPVAGYMFHEVGIRVWQATFLRVRDRTWWQFFSWGLNWVFGSTSGAIILLLAGLSTPAVQRLPSPGLAMLGVLVIALALWNLVSGVWRVRTDKSFAAEYWSKGDGKTGAAMLSVFFWTGVFIVANAGLDFYGL